MIILGVVGGGGCPRAAFAFAVFIIKCCRNPCHVGRLYVPVESI